MQEMQIYW